jgi:heme-degrading monooxygenase HmoA
MIARVVSVSARPESIGEIKGIYERSIMPVLKQQPGMKEAYLFVNPSTGEGMSVTLWQSEAQASAYESGGTFQQLLGTLRQFMTSQPTVKTFEVGAHT